MPSMTTDYKEITGNPRPYLARIADAGFTEVHWCHEWCTDYLYATDEMTAIKTLLDLEFNLKVNSLHASSGPHPVFFWWGHDEDDEQARGRRLMRNRLELAARLECDTVVIHLPWFAENGDATDVFAATVDAGLYEMIGVAAEYGVRLAVENHVMERNGALQGNQAALDGYFEKYSVDELGYCYDSGHGNMVAGGLDHAEKWKDRLTALHLHDNDGLADLHLLPFDGNMAWERLAEIIAVSTYSKVLNLECSMREYPETEEDAYLARAFSAAERLTGMVAEAAAGA